MSYIYTANTARKVLYFVIILYKILILETFTKNLYIYSILKYFPHDVDKEKYLKNTFKYENKI